MAGPPNDTLPRRQRQVLEVLHRRGPSTAAEVMTALPDALSNSTVRTTLRILEAKGHVRHHEHDGQYVYTPVEAPAATRRAAVRHLVRTFFRGSTPDAVASLLGADPTLTAQDLDRIAALIARARGERP